MEKKINKRYFHNVIVQKPQFGCKSSEQILICFRMKIVSSTVLKPSMIVPAPLRPFRSFIHLSIILNFIFTVRKMTSSTNGLDFPPENKSQRMRVYELRRQKVCHSRFTVLTATGQQRYARPQGCVLENPRAWMWKTDIIHDMETKD